MLASIEFSIPKPDDGIRKVYRRPYELVNRDDLKVGFVLNQKDALLDSQTKDMVIRLKRDYRLIQERLMRCLDLTCPLNNEDFICALWWMIEQGIPADLRVLRAIRVAPPVENSFELSRLMSMTVRRILERVENLEEINPWIAACALDKKLIEDEILELLEYIITAQADLAPQLMELGESRHCQSLFRVSAINRLVVISPNIHTLFYLFQLYDESEPDEEVRSKAYQNFHYLKVAIGHQMDEAEQSEEQLRIEHENSPRMRWLMSLDSDMRSSTLEK